MAAWARLLRIVPLLLAGFWAGSVKADDCDFARENLALYEANCAGADGCASMARMEGIVAGYCGASPQAPAIEPAPVQTPRATPEPAPPKPRDIGLASGEIAGLQQALAALGFRVGAADGVIGPATRAAVEAFQSAHGLPATGDIDKATLDAILAAAAAIAKPEGGAACAVLADLRKMDFEREWRGAVGRFEALKELRADLLKLRAELASDAYFDAGQWREATAALLQAAATTGNLATNLIRLNPATSATSSLIAELIDAGKKADQILRGGYEQTLLELWVEMKAKANPAFQAAKTAYDFANDMHALSEIPAGFRQMRDAAAEGIGRLDAQLAGIERDLIASRAWMQTADTAVRVLEQKCETEKAGGVAVPRIL